VGIIYQVIIGTYKFMHKTQESHLRGDYYFF